MRRIAIAIASVALGLLLVAWLFIPRALRR